MYLSPVPAFPFTIDEALPYFRPITFSLFKRFPVMGSMMEVNEFVSEFVLHIDRSKYLQKYGTADRVAPKFCYLYKGMANKALDLIRENVRRVKTVKSFSSQAGEDSSGGDLSVYDVFPDTRNINVLGELILQEAIDILPKNRMSAPHTLITHKDLDKDRPLFDVYRYKKWGILDGKVVSEWVEEKRPVMVVWFCHYWIYFLHLQDWSNNDIAKLFSVSSNRIYQIVSECRQKLSILFEEDKIYKVKVVPSKKTVDDIDEYFQGWVDVPKEKDVAILKSGVKVDLDKVRDRSRIDRVFKQKLTEGERFSIGVERIKSLPHGITYEWEF